MEDERIEKLEEENRKLLEKLTDLKVEHADTLSEIEEHLDDLDNDLKQLEEALSGANASIRFLRKLI